MDELEQFLIESELYDTISDIGYMNLDNKLESYIEYVRCQNREKLLMESSNEFSFDEFVLESDGENSDKNIFEKVLSFLKSIFVIYSPEHLCRLIDKVPDEKWERLGKANVINYECIYGPLLASSILEAVHNVLNSRKSDELSDGSGVDKTTVDIVNKTLDICEKFAKSDNVTSVKAALGGMTLNDIDTETDVGRNITASMYDVISNSCDEIKTVVKDKKSFKKHVNETIGKPLRKIHKDKEYLKYVEKVEQGEPATKEDLKNLNKKIRAIHKLIGKAYRKFIKSISNDDTDNDVIEERIKSNSKGRSTDDALDALDEDIDSILENPEASDTKKDGD